MSITTTEPNPQKQRQQGRHHGTPCACIMMQAYLVGNGANGLRQAGEQQAQLGVRSCGHKEL